MNLQSLSREELEERVQVLTQTNNEQAATIERLDRVNKRRMAAYLRVSARWAYLRDELARRYKTCEPNSLTATFLLDIWQVVDTLEREEQDNAYDNEH